MIEPKCCIPECEDEAIHPEYPFCHPHAVDLIVSLVQATTLHPE